jgi:hypothetical protein
MTTIERLESYLKKHMGEFPPEIRYFNGNDEEGGKPFSLLGGSCSGATLDKSLNLFLKRNGF